MTQQLLSELQRVKCLFQLRTLTLHLGTKPPETLPPQSNSKDTER